MENFMNKLGHFYNGKAQEGESGRFGDVFDPATGEVQSHAAYANTQEIDKIVRLAAVAQKEWGATSAVKRASVLFKFRELIIAKKNEIAEIIGKEHGKTMADALGEIQRGLDVVEFGCGIPNLLKGGFSQNIGGSIDIFNIREPIGVVGGISPFNFPFMVPLWMGVMAIACGNSFINKCSERDPSASIKIAQLLSEAGLPDNIWNVVNGDKEAVDGLLHHPMVQAISFVGSTPVGEYVYQEGCKHNKRVQAFCGAKNHMIIMPDADMNQAVDALVGSGYGSAGQRCMAISVAVPVGKGTAEELTRLLKPRVAEMKIGPYHDKNAEINPLITRQAKERVERLIESGVKQGAGLVVDGRGKSLQGYENGFWVGGTLLNEVRTDMDCYVQEIFGPVLSIMQNTSFENAVKMINDHEYGNGTSIFTRDGDAARAFYEKVDVGMVGINVPIPVPTAFHHFGGSKRSKFGDTQMYGPESVVFFTKMKTISTRWPSGVKEGAEFAMPTHR